MQPSSWHGVTTVVTGNCGVGFAPVRAADHDMLISVMEGVEDIPGIVMKEGVPWNWESFPEYMDALAVRQYDMDVAVQVAHSPIRVYVMGERGAAHEESTPQDRAAMTKIVAEAVRSGAVGVSTSRSSGHRLKNGVLAPSVSTVEDELAALAQGLRQAGGGVFQLITETDAPAEVELAHVRRVAQEGGRPVSFTLLQAPHVPEKWRELLAGIEQANKDGMEVRGQVFPRPVGVMIGLELTLHPFVQRPSYKAIAGLPLAERVKAMRDPALKVRILGEENEPDPQPMNNMLIAKTAEMFVLRDPVNYAPPVSEQLGARAAAAGVSLESFAYDVLLEDEGRVILCLPGANYVGNTLDAAREMMASPHTVIGLGDGGAHYGFICDASYPTTLLTHWVRDQSGSGAFPLEWVVQSLTSKTAQTVKLMDRGLLAVGYKADINIIDTAALKLHAPSVVRDLPAGGRRLQQRAEGYVATIVNGVVTYRNGEATGALPGRLVRGGAWVQPLERAA